MAKRDLWERNMMQAATRLVRCAAKAAAALDPSDTTVRDIRELAATLKELSALHNATARERDETEDTPVEVVFTEGETWSR